MTDSPVCFDIASSLVRKVYELGGQLFLSDRKDVLSFGCTRPLGEKGRRIAQIINLAESGSGDFRHAFYRAWLDYVGIEGDAA